MYEVETTILEEFLHDEIEKRVFHGAAEVQKIPHVALAAADRRQKSDDLFKVCRVETYMKLLDDRGIVG